MHGPILLEQARDTRHESAPPSGSRARRVPGLIDGDLQAVRGLLQNRIPAKMISTKHEDRPSSRQDLPLLGEKLASPLIPQPEASNGGIRNRQSGRRIAARSPALIGDIPCHFGSFPPQLGEGGLDVVTHEVEFVVTLAVSWTNSKLGRGQRETLAVLI